ncbi:hypothetical protein Lalb_Chr09g0330541 [Lupinus albus]|uniref:Uncharacterized protein n=1 Tax=Lupinus albus TaxID=3870 RepID=A0A6A4Q094_LUPAL|nr:hypothetical protein Lalb_Chr09g0330541 [Lupinus albus]
MTCNPLALEGTERIIPKLKYSCNTLYSWREPSATQTRDLMTSWINSHYFNRLLPLSYFSLVVMTHWNQYYLSQTPFRGNNVGFV